ncbi:MAG: hypothetical protein PHV51_00955 [Methanosarcinaceae archaeon]|nr:hypothetical protein [Methanosarcinaceae archaeon]
MIPSLEHPELLLLIIPLIIGGTYLLKNTGTKLVEWRMLVALLLIIALASPFTVVTKTVTDENPSLVIISDETNSMDIFKEGTGQRLYESLVDNTPTAFVRLTGDKTSLGDSVLQYAGSGQQIVLVSDGNNNYGKSLVDALEFARKTGTTVYAVHPTLEKNDLAVEVKGDKTLVVDNENNFEIIVSQAGEDSAGFNLEVYLDEKLNLRRSYSLARGERETSIIFRPDPLTTLGAHNLRVKITPSGEDWNAINNEFYKALYVVPKPKITLITEEPDSPLSQVLSDLYEVSIMKKLPEMETLEENKALVIDNMYIATLSENDVNDIKKYVTGGKGLIVVGGNKAYDKTSSKNYRNSSFEDVLPVVSKPSDWHGGRNIILIVDQSQSLSVQLEIYVLSEEEKEKPGGGKYTEEQIQNMPSVQKDIQAAARSFSFNVPLAIADSIINDPEIIDAELLILLFAGEVTYVTEDFVDMNIEANREYLIKELINTSTPGGTPTSLSLPLEEAKKILAKQEGQSDIIIISDGGLTNGDEEFQSSLNMATQLTEDGANLYFIHLSYLGTNKISPSGRFVYAEELMKRVDGKYLEVENKSVTKVNIGLKAIEREPSEGEEAEEDSGPWPIREFPSNHFIIKNINVSAIISGYNDVTPKAGAERLISTNTGKPVLTTWRYGLGRVAALTTDNGGKKAGEEGGWSTALYTGSNAHLIPSMTNWAIGNPLKEEGVVLEGPDTWLGSSSDLTATMYEEGVPQIKVGEETPDLALTGRDTYEGTIAPDSIKVHNVSVFVLEKRASGISAEYRYNYPVAVNYPLEFRDVGINKGHIPLILSTGGKTYGEREARAYLLKDARENAEREVQEPRSLKPYFILAALLLYLGEVMVRRIREIKRLKKTEAAQEANKEAAEIGE